VNFVNQLLLNPKMGIDLGENIFKVRIPNSSIQQVKVEVLEL
jgi:hypothetical protein